MGNGNGHGLPSSDNVNYVVIGPQELQAARANRSFFESQYPLVYASPTGEVF